MEGYEDTFLDDYDAALVEEDPENAGEIWNQFLESLAKFGGWIVARLVPAFLLWVGIYLLFLSMGIDLSQTIRGDEKYTNIVIWVFGWLFVGVLGIFTMQFVRTIFVIPFVILIGAAWILVGLVFWIPRFGFAALDSGVRSFTFVMTGGKSVNPAEILSRAFLYYMEGFEIIGSVLTNREVPESERTPERMQAELSEMYRSLKVSFLYLLLYIPLLVLLIWLKWIPGISEWPALSDLSLPVPDIELGDSRGDGNSPARADRFRDRLADGSICTFCPEMVVIPQGKYFMGSDSSEIGRAADEGPVHWVRIRYSLAVSRYEVTFAQWDACARDRGCNGYFPADEGWGRGNRPVINVNWHDAQSFVRWLSRKTGKTYRLLSEAEWEYACRAGSRTPFHFGLRISTDQANYDGRYRYMNGGIGIYRAKTIRVGSFAPNRFGLFDMHGNVREWVEDCWNGSYRGAPTDGKAWKRGDCERRLLRGGSWFNSAKYVRSADRFAVARSQRASFHGIRVARELAPG